MYPIPQQICKGKTYDRRSEEEQQIYEQHKKTYVEEQQRQTTFEDKENRQTNIGEEEFIGPREDTNTQRDCTAIKRPTNKVKMGRLFKNEKEEGTRLTSISLSGSQFDYEFMLEHCKDH
eukprot:3500920-Heterocapsa_arctica.AAC.1